MAFSSSKSPPPLLPHQSFHFTPIQECEEEQQSATTATPTPKQHQLTPLHHYHHHHQSTPLHHHPSQNPRHKKRQEPTFSDGSVSCNKCRPNTHREKISVVPLDNNRNSSMSSPNAMFKFIFHSFTKKSPKTTQLSREEQWKSAVTELSQKLITTTRKKEEAVSEASRLKTSMEELEKKLNKLEVYCHNLKSGIEECAKKQSNTNTNTHFLKNPNLILNDRLINQFLNSVTESRSSIRLLSRSLVTQLRHVDGKIHEKISILLQPYDVKINSSNTNPKKIIFYLEALLNIIFFEDFESIGFSKNPTTRILNPVERCESKYASFSDLVSLTWEEVLSKGTKDFCEEFSKFCDVKMSEIVSMLGWTRAWPEPLLQSFFCASKSVWLVHLLANSVHPGLQIFRIEKGARFDPVYMEDMGVDRVGRSLVPVLVRVMVQPGFYVYSNVVKCKVVCRYDHSNLDSGRLSPSLV